MKKLFFTVLLSSLCLLGGLIESSKWVPTNGGNKGALPDFAMVDSPSGKAAQVTVVEKNPYQGMHFYLNEPIDLNGIKSVSFRVKQNASEKYPVNACLQLHYNEKRSQGFYVSFSIKAPDANGWSDVTIPLESAKKYPLQRNGEISMGLAISGTFSLYAALQEPGQSLAISNLQFNPKEEAVKEEAVKEEAVKEEAVKEEAVSILGTNLVESSKWASMNGGHVGANPDLKIIDSPYGKSVQITVVEKNPYQSVDFFLKEPIDLNGIGSVTFRMKQNARTAFPSKGCLQLQYDAQHKSGLYIPFVIPKPGTDGWSSVNVPIDVRTARSLQRNVAAYLSNAVCGNISLYSYLQDVGQYMSIADLRFNPMLNKVGKIPVANYVYRSTRTSGDSKGNILTDGNVEEKDQVYYQQYAEDADIIFDLGAFYLVKKIDVASFAIPGQNFFEYHVYVSNDGDEWKPGAIVTSKDDGGTKKAYSVSGENLSLLGRFFRIKTGRSRTDFPVYLAEVTFTGKIPTQEELDQVVAATYDVGPELSGDAWEVKVGDSSVKIDKTHGIAFDYVQNGQKVAERIFGRYELNDGFKNILGTDYTATILSSQKENNGYSFTFTVPEIKDVTFKRTYGFEEGMLTSSLSFESKRTDKQIFYTATEVVIPYELRDGGLYESWGAGHDMQHMFANEVIFRTPADTGPVMVFESPKNNKSLLHFRYKHNGRYIQIGSGTVTVTGLGDKRTFFLPTGWLLGDGVYQLSEPGAKGSVETRLIISDGDVTNTFDRYLALKEVKAFRSGIRRPSWLKEIRFQTSQGWSGLWGDVTMRQAARVNSFIREGKFVFGLCDNDFIWGDFPTSGNIMNVFGGQLTFDEVLQREEKIRKASNNNAILYQYTWLWSVSSYSKVFKEHPEWFITKNAKGEKISFFPGWGTNYYRHLKDPECWKRMVKEMTDFTNAYGVEMWYLDGGGSPVSINWERMSVDEPDAYDSAYLAIRNNIQKKNPDAGVFFNHPENPLGDIGFLENGGGVMSRNWRDGATWMYKFKLWQRPDPLFMPTYIYWTKEVDIAMRQYIVGTGLSMVARGPVNDQRRNIPYMSAVQQSRWARLVNANVSPNWRYSPKEMLENMPLTFGPDGWIFMKNQDKKTVTKKVSFDAAAIGLTDKGTPLYHWEYALKDIAEMVDLQNESDREKSYTDSRWQSGFVITPAFLAKTNYVASPEREFSIDALRLKLWYLTQSPALVWSVDNMRIQMPLSYTMGVEVKGRETADGMTLSAKSERKTAELAALIPSGKIAVSVKVNGKTIAFDTVIWGGTPMVVFPVAKGNSDIKIAFGEAKCVAGSYKISATAGQPLKLDISGPAASVVAAVHFGADLVWSKELTLTGDGVTEAIAVPKSVTGGNYTVLLFDMTGKKLASGSFRQAAGTPGTGPEDYSEYNPVVESRKAYPKAVETRGVKLYCQAEHHSEKTGEVLFTPDNAALEIRLKPMIPVAANEMAGAFEISSKRYLKVRITGNYATMGELGPFNSVRNFTQYYGSDGIMAALQFDFEGKGGYSVRSFAGLGVMKPPVNTNEPKEWGAVKEPDHLFTIASIVCGVDAKDENEMWLDLMSLGAPADWTGKLWFGMRFTHANPNRHLKVEILESTDVLPNGVTAVDPYALKGGVKPPEQPKVHALPMAKEPISLDGKLNEASWKDALVFNQFSLIGNPAVKAPETTVRMLRDSAKVYISVVMTDNHPLSGDNEKKCWRNDGVELYFQTRSNLKSTLHFIVDVVDNSYWHSVENYEDPRSPEKDLGKPEFASSRNGNVWTMELSFPISLLGDGASVTGFNFGRNRIINSTAQNYSIAHGKGYNVYSANLIQW